MKYTLISGNSRLKTFLDRHPEVVRAFEGVLGGPRGIVEWIRSAIASIFNPPKAILDEALDFQGDLVHLLEEPLPKGMRGTVYYCLSLFAVALAVAILFKVDVVVQGGGKLTYDGPPIVIQPFDRAVLRSLNVKLGEFVHQGQVLVTLDPTFVEADHTALEERVKMVHAQVKRLEAEVFGKVYQPDSADGTFGMLQVEIYLQRSTEYKSRIKSFDETVAESESALQRVQTEKGILEEQFAISTSIEGMQENLFKFKTNSKLEYLAAKSSRLRSERDFRDASDRLLELKHHIQAAIAQRDGFIQEWRRNLLEELTRQRSEESQVAASLIKSSKLNSRVVISAPEDGVVLDIAHRSIGSVLRDAEPLIILVPSAAPLLCEIQLTSSEVGDVAVGDPVLIKVDAFPFQRYGGLQGRIRFISHESHGGGNSGDLEAEANKRSVAGGGLHKVVVELVTTRMAGLPPSRSLFPGMTVSGEVHIGKRRLINYLLYPILRGLRESFRES